MAKKASSLFDSAGWLFWLILFLAFLAPCIITAWKFSYAHASRIFPIGVGVVMAALSAGIMSWAVNSVLQSRLKKQRIAERKKTKKRK